MKKKSLETNNNKSHLESFSLTMQTILIAYSERSGRVKLEKVLFH